MTKDRMKQLIIGIQITALSVFLYSCVRDDGGDDCGIYLEFIYDYNMEYADSFDPQVDVVDAFVFNADEKFLFTKRVERSQLLNQKRMLLESSLPFGTYKVLTIGGLYDDFLLSDEAGQELIPGVTTIEQVRLSLISDTKEVTREFFPLWFGTVVTFENTSDRVVCPVYLIKNTNRFNLSLVRSDEARSTSLAEIPSYTFEIVAPESAVYSYENKPLLHEDMIYKPYYLAPGTEPDNISVGHINTCRLFYGEEYKYRLIVRNTKNQQILWDYDLMVLLANTKPDVKGKALPMQEYLDRQSEWNIAILYKRGESGEGFVAIAVEINDWIMWLKDIDI